MKSSKIKIFYLSLSIMITCIIILLLANNVNNQQSINKENGKELTTGIAMMLETTAGSGEYVKTEDTPWADVVARGYIFNSEKSTCKNGSTISWNNKNKTITLSGNVTDNCTAYFDNYLNTSLSSYIIKSVGTDQGDGKLVNENGIRYEGTNPNNYVQFNDELWRIIGVFDENVHSRSGEKLVKLIRAESLPGFYQANDVQEQTNWDDLKLNALLNTNYYNNTEVTSYNDYVTSKGTTIQINIGIKEEKTRNLIQPIYWKIGGDNYSGDTAIDYYTFETSGGSGISKKEWYINLMYTSDYGYAVLESDCVRSISVHNYGTDNPLCHENNWLFHDDKYYWQFLYSYTANGIVSGVEFWEKNGDFQNWYDTNGLTWPLAIRPVLYLKQGVKITGGSGTSTNPYTLAY